MMSLLMVSRTLPAWQFASLHLFSFGRSRLPKTQLETADRHVTVRLGQKKAHGSRHAFLPSFSTRSDKVTGRIAEGQPYQE